MTSSDGGHSWKQTGQFVTGGPVTPEIQIHIASGPGGLLWASLFDLGSCAMHGCATAELLRSEDGGRTWGTVNLSSAALGCGWSSITFSAAPDGSVMAAAGINGAACSPPLGMLYQYGPSGWRRLPSWTLTSVGSLRPSAGMSPTPPPVTAGAAWDLVGSLPPGKGANDGIAGPWMSADGHGLRLTLTGTEPWREAQGGASGLARIWTTRNWGATWTEGGLLPLHGETLQGPVSFGYTPGSGGGLASALTGGEAGWTGWLIVATARFRMEIVSTRGKALVQMHVPVGNGLQLISSRTGFAWSITYAGPVPSGLVTLYRTTDGGRSWQHAQFRLDLAAGSLGVS